MAAALDAGRTTFAGWNVSVGACCAQVVTQQRDDVSLRFQGYVFAKAGMLM